MNFKITFDPSMRDVLEETLKEEEKIFSGKQTSLKMRMFGWAWKKAMGIEMMTIMNYNFVSDTECLLTITTGADAYINEKMMLLKLKQWESDSNGKIKIELMEDKK